MILGFSYFSHLTYQSQGRGSSGNEVCPAFLNSLQVYGTLEISMFLNPALPKRQRISKR